VRISNNEHNQAVFNLTSDMIVKVHEQVAVTLQAGSFGVPIQGKKADNLFVGYCGEIAVAEYLDVPWESEYIQNRARQGDVMGYQVKTTLRHDGKLLTNPNKTIHGGAMPAGIYILVTLDSSEQLATIRGWEDSRNLWTADLWQPGMPDPCYAQDQEHLNPMKHLPDTPQMRSFKASWAS
jgi:hypothetical protein